MCGMLGFVGDNVLGNVQATVSARACVVGSVWGGGERSRTYLIYDVSPQYTTSLILIKRTISE